ncbi:MAG: hypothetical protein ACOH2R_10765 [Pseudomonas sp.]
MNQGSKAVVVNAGSMLFFLDNTDQSERKDTLDSTLYSQLTASKEHSKFTELADWSNRYLAASLRFGWMLRSSESISQSVADQPLDTVWGWIRNTHSAAGLQAAVEEGEALARQSYRDHPDQHAISLFARQAIQCSADNESRAVVIQLGFTGPMSTLILIRVSFTTRQFLTPTFLFDPVTPQDIVGNVDLTFYSMELRGELYSLFREGIDAGLNDRRAEFVCPLQVADHVQ